MAKKKSGRSPVIAALMVFVGVVFFLFGAGLDLTIVGLPAGIPLDAIGVLLALGGLGVGVFGQSGGSK